MTLKRIAPLLLSILIGAANAGAAASAASPAQQPSSEPNLSTGRDRLTQWLTDQASLHTRKRRSAVQALETEDQARVRQAQVRAQIVELTGYRSRGGPVVSHITGRSPEDGFEIETLWYESEPGYRVSANLYRPNRATGPSPALLIQPGHGADGKIGDYVFAAAFARAGYIVLSIDIVGEGERLQHYDAETGASKVGRPTGEHSMAFGQALPTGGHVSRWFIQDAVRGLDYLMSLPEVDPDRIGAFGCSGGGTLTAYLTALDPRVKAAASACYINDFDHLLAPGGPGPQDAEQSIPNFISSGLDLPDWIELAAPRPYAVVATTQDMFPIDGARAAFDEASRFYGLFGAQDRLTLIEGPGRHGALAPVAPRILGFFNQWIGPDQRSQTFDAPPLGDQTRLLVAKTSDSQPGVGGETLQGLIRRQAGPMLDEIDNRPQPLDQQSLIQVVRDVTQAVTPIGAEVVVSEAPSFAQTEGSATHLTFNIEGMQAPAVFVRPSHDGARPTLILASKDPFALVQPAVDAWTSAGWNVLWIEARGSGGTEEVKSALTGDWTLLSLRALLIGRNPVGLRVDDILTGINWLAHRPEADPDRLVLAAHGALGPVALHAAALDPRIHRVAIDRSILSYRDLVERPISRDMAEVNPPGVLQHYDLPDLARSLGDRLSVFNPVNAVGEPLSAQQAAAFAPLASIAIRSPRDGPVISPEEFLK